MADVKWIKIAADIFDNRKIRQIECLPEGDGIIVIWFKLLCLAGNINDNGMVYFAKDIPYTDQMLAVHFNRPITLVQMALATFENFGMIEIVDNLLHVSNWEKYQNVDGMEKIKEQNRIRQKRWRDQQKKLLSDAANVNNVSPNVRITQPNAVDIDIELDIDKDNNLNKDLSLNLNSNDLNKDKGQKRFAPPSVEEVRAYCLERNNSVDPEHFVSYYTSNGWFVGKNKMKDWKAAVRTWERNGYISNTRNGYVSNAPKGANGIAISEGNSDLDELF